MEIIAVADKPLVPENRDQLVDGQVFCVDEEGWHDAPGMLTAFVNASTGGAEFDLPDGVGRQLPFRREALGFDERDRKRIRTTALSRPEDVNLHFLIDGDGDARDLLAYYHAAATYVVKNGGNLNFYGKGVGGPFAELSMFADKRFLTREGKLTFRNPAARPPVVRYSPAVGQVDYANGVYWSTVRKFLLRNAVAGMRDKMRGLLAGVEQNPANVQREISFTAEDAWDMGLIEEPRENVDDLCRAFEVRCGECVEHLPEDHSVSRFFDVEGRDERYAQLIALTQTKNGRGEEAGKNSSGRGTRRGGHLRLLN